MNSIESINFGIIIPWRMGNPDRERSLKNLLNCLKVQYLHPNFGINYELTIVEQTLPEKAVEACKRVVEIIPQEIKKYNYYQCINSNPEFNKSWCMNVGARYSKSEYLIFTDADSLFGDKYLKEIKNYIEKNAPKIFMCWDYLTALPGKDNPISRHITPNHTRAMGGIWCAARNFYFEELGGMNENYWGYGGEDNDAYERAAFILSVENIPYMNYPLVHQYHDWEKPSPYASQYVEMIMGYPQIISQRLKEVRVGNIEKPTLIKMEKE